MRPDLRGRRGFWCRAGAPGLAQALDYARAGDTIVVTKLDRAGRSLANLLGLVATLAEHGIGFRSLGEQIDTESASGKLLLHVLGAIAEFERALIVDRTRAGLDAARSRGRLGGRPVECTPEKVEAARLMIASEQWSVPLLAARLRLACPGRRCTRHLRRPAPRAAA